MRLGNFWRKTVAVKSPQRRRERRAESSDQINSALSALNNKPKANQLLNRKNRLPSQTQNVKLFTGLGSEPERS